MSPTTAKLAEDIKLLPDLEKAALVNEILEQLHLPNRSVEDVWAKELAQRVKAAEDGRMTFEPYESAMASLRQQCASASAQPPIAI